VNVNVNVNIGNGGAGRRSREESSRYERGRLLQHENRKWKWQKIVIRVNAGMESEARRGGAQGDRMADGSNTILNIASKVCA
jgi:hypothetical protein